MEILYDFFFGGDNLTMLWRLCLAALLGGAIGTERLVSGQTAGLRTHMLVSTGAALFTLISLRIGASGSLGHLGDPGRIAAQIVSGIGFLGAGTIIHSGLNTKGLTTSACLWMSAALGMACAAEMPGIAILLTVITLLSLVIFKCLERICLRRQHLQLVLRTRTTAELEEVRDALCGLHGTSVKIRMLTQRDGITEAVLTLNHPGVGTQASIPPAVAELLAAQQARLLSYELKCE